MSHTQHEVRRYTTQSGVVVTIPHYAEVSENIPLHTHDGILSLRKAIRSVVAHHIGDKPMIVRHCLDTRAFNVDVVPTSGRAVTWHERSAHTARSVEGTPFVSMRGRIPRTNIITLVLVKQKIQSRTVITVVRVIAGEYYPPVPWQRSAENEPKGYDYCVEFWRKNAIPLSQRTVANRRTLPAPSWYTRQLSHAK